MIALLLHMHQPDYRHPRTGAPIMPWVRLHATRGYRDVARILAETGAKATVNLVPTLLEQVDRYVAGGSDVHLDVCCRPAAELAPAEAEWLVTHGLHGSARAFEWFPGWGALRARRDRGERFDVAALRDLQVWGNLAWFGATALEDFPELGELRRKGAGFTEAEKAVVLARQAECVAGLRALYAALPEVSASPYAHPILPLLVDTAHAARNLGAFDDPAFRWPEDALGQLVAGRAAVAAWVGREVRGLWPSEGSVSPEAVELFAKAGFSWFATDDGVLARSERQGKGPTWQVGPLRGLFRDHGLSDRIGFVYADQAADTAVEDLLARTAGRDVVLALDGENPWESYKDAGAGFLRRFFAKAPLVPCGELAARPATGTVSRLHTGSWINADFKIWIGAEEDRTAWRLLRRVREAFAASVQPEDARRALWRAEASDWFWWYGPEFETPFAGEFDVLFRAHLADVLARIGAPAMPELDAPLRATGGGVVAPVGPVDPDRADFFAWNAAGSVAITSGSMAPGPGWPVRVEYGWGPRGLALRLVGAGEGTAPGWTAEVEEGESERPLLWLRTPEGRRVPDSGGWRLLRPTPRP